MEKNYKENKEKWNQDLKDCLDVLNNGGLILYPTDTVWGLGCDATNKEAVKKIYDLKNRSDNKAMIALVDSEGMLQNFVSQIPDIAWDLVENASEPLTIIYDNPRGLAENLLAEDGSLGVRITSEKFSSELCKRFRKPIVSTSANISGEKTPKSFKEISEEIKARVDYIVKYRQDEDIKSKPSHIIKLSDGGVIKIIR